MSVKIIGWDKPESCAECPFRAKTEEVSVRKYKEELYKKMSYCTLQLKIRPDVDDFIWRNVYWQIDNIEDFCPIVDLKEE